MESSLHGVPISATQTLSGIRAPLTVDESDFDYSASSKSRRNSTTSSYYSGSELDSSEDFVGSEDNFVTASSDPNEEIHQETNFLEKNAFSSPPLVSPIRGVGSGNVSFRPVVRNLDERISNADDSEDEGYVLSNVDSRPIVAIMDGEVSKDAPFVEFKSPVLQKLRIPIAQVSGEWESDDDSHSNEVLEDGDFGGIVRVPSIEVLHRINSALKVRMVESDGDSDYEADKMVEKMDFVVDSKEEEGYFGPDESVRRVVSLDTIQDEDRTLKNSDCGADNVVEKMDFGEDLKDGEGHFGPEESVHRVVSLDMIQDEDLTLKNSDCGAESSVDKLDFVEDLKGEEGYFGPEESVRRVVSLVTIQDKGPNIKNSDCGAEISVEKMDFVEDLKDEEGNFGSEESTRLAESSDMIQDKGLNFDQEAAANFLVANDEYNRTSESGQNGDLVYLDKQIQENDEDCKSIDTGLEDNLVFNHDIEIEKLENESEGMNFVEPFSLTDAQKPESVCQYVDIRELLEAHSGSLELDTSSGVSNAGELAFKEAENVRDSSFHTISLLNEESLKEKSLNERENEQLEKIQCIRVIYLQLLHKLGYSPEDSVASKILHRLSTAEAKLSSQPFHLDSAVKEAIREKGDLDISLCILVIGKTGVGKSATINTLFGETKTAVNAFEPSTNCVKEIIGTINGVKVKVFDTPGLGTSSMEDQSINRRVLSSIKKVMKKTPPDVILYIDRLDTQTDNNLNDLHVMKSVASCLGSSMWRKSILVLTHGNSIFFSDGLDEGFVAAQKLRGFRELIRRSSMEMNGGPLIPVCVVENHSCGESWRLELLLLCCSIKTLSESSSSIIATENNLVNNRKKLFGLQTTLSYLLSVLLQPNFHRKQRCNDVSDLYLDLEFLSLSDIEGIEGNDDNTPPLKPMKKKSQIVNLSMGQRRGYFEEFNSRAPVKYEIEAANRFSPEITAQLNDDKQELNIKLHSPVPLGLTVVRHRGEMYACKLGSRFSVGGKSSVNACFGMNSRLNGQICIKARNSDQLQIAAVAVFLPVAGAVFRGIFRRSDEDN
ncbi:hypothetical protein ABFS83_07G013900 [Erythranthe nasuta]